MINDSYYLGGNIVDISVINHNGTLKYFWGDSPWLDGVLVDNILTLSGVDALSSTPGTYRLTIIVGNYFNEQVEFIFIFAVDQEKPEIVQTNPIPDYNGTRFLKSVILSFTITDNLTAISQLTVLYSIDGLTNMTFLSPFQIYLSGLNDGSHNLTIIAIDIDGNSLRYFITFIIDTTIPSTTVTITGLVTAPDGLHYIPANTLVDVMVSDADPNTHSYYRWNSTEYISFTNSFTLPAIEGYAKLDVKANDTLGNTRIRTYYLTIDASAPTITLFLLTNHSKINTKTPIHFKVNDLKGNTIDYVETEWDLGTSVIQTNDFYVQLLADHLFESEAEISLYTRDLV